MFKPLKTLRLKAKVAEIVETYLTSVVGKQGLYGLSPKHATKMVNAVYNKSPDVFNGNRGLPPHHVIFAARAFMSAASDTSQNNPQRLVYWIV